MKDKNCFESIHSALTSYTGDLSKEENLAWIYGIIIGWNDESLDDLSKSHQWTQKDIERLKRLRAEYMTKTV